MSDALVKVLESIINRRDAQVLRLQELLASARNVSEQRRQELEALRAERRRLDILRPRAEPW
jgi:hypothetical protein